MVLKAFSMSRGRLHFQNHCGLGGLGLKGTKDQRPDTEVPLHFWCGVKKDITSRETAWIQGFGEPDYGIRVLKRVPNKCRKCKECLYNRGRAELPALRKL